ncbi:PilZ domain-containing protein [Neiella marina]|uniref:PilZ domain-containing protein n=1 Tax=Neiella holothuriorum TaxID=2870530 RepID=A0ABS7ECG3_9GAMM|nr:PilZ domain-containing protein [Neiella holothuriorum]MBW8190026.1 PilZ domain-containing protein [Neiella holothuriorum]
MITQGERRNFIRMSVETAIRIKRAANGDELSGTCLNLSATGAAVLLSEPLNMDEEVEIFIDSTGQDIRPLEASAKVQRVDTLAEDKFDVGLEITGYK